ncbi:MAG: DUF1559 domain-containing protein [Planctomycetaceae bacterium]
MRPQPAFRRSGDVFGDPRALDTRAGFPRRKSGFTVLELLTTIAIIGILLALILPAVHSAREAARQLQCTNNLRQIGLALHIYHDQHGSLPAAWQRNKSSQSSVYGWGVRLLPFLEQHALYGEIIRPSLNVGAGSYQRVRHQHLAMFLCPSDLTEPTFRLYEEQEDESFGRPAELLTVLPTANYVGVYGTYEPDDAYPPIVGDGAFSGPVPRRFRDFQRGLSNTILVGEREMARIPSTWFGVDFRGEDAACRIVGNAEKGPNQDSADECEFGSRHSGATNFLWGDGRVQSVSDSIDAGVYRRSARLRGF